MKGSPVLGKYLRRPPRSPSCTLHSPPHKLILYNPITLPDPRDTLFLIPFFLCSLLCLCRSWSGHRYQKHDAHVCWHHLFCYRDGRDGEAGCSHRHHQFYKPSGMKKVKHSDLAILGSTISCLNCNSLKPKSTLAAPDPALLTLSHLWPEASKRGERGRRRRAQCIGVRIRLGALECRTCWARLIQIMEKQIIRKEHAKRNGHKRERGIELGISHRMETTNYLSGSYRDSYKKSIPPFSDKQTVSVLAWSVLWFYEHADTAPLGILSC